MAVMPIEERLLQYGTDFSQEKKASQERSDALLKEISKVANSLRQEQTKYSLVGDTVVARETADKAATAVADLQKAVIDLEKNLLSRISTLGGGGNMNRNIAVGGNTSVLSKWTDINLKPGAGTTITYAANDTTGYTDITITATGSGSGITRQVNSINTSQTADGTAGIDQVYIASAG